MMANFQNLPGQHQVTSEIDFTTKTCVPSVLPSLTPWAETCAGFSDYRKIIAK